MKYLCAALLGLLWPLCAPWGWTIYEYLSTPASDARTGAGDFSRVV
jgi:hypothetical protein